MSTNPNMQKPFQPGFKRPDNNDMIPPVLVRAMFGLAAISLALVAFASVTGRERAAIPAPAPVVQSWSIRLVGNDAQSVTVLDAGGNLIADMDHGGFCYGHSEWAYDNAPPATGLIRHCRWISSSLKTGALPRLTR
jgi:hypothetical protein